jgi:hypothetical protein
VKLLRPILRMTSSLQGAGSGLRRSHEAGRKGCGARLVSGGQIGIIAAISPERPPLRVDEEATARR